MRVHHDRDADTNLIKDPVRTWRFVIGAVCAIAAVAIWGGWLVMMRGSVTTTLTAFDLTALRFAVTACKVPSRRWTWTLKVVAFSISSGT
jgi:hypothetical protein